ncbi:MAG: hypothetical protein NUV55_08490 [Sulfuricaulis sp.]|uniref:hypothetical protein n=1 Tax=Sulfuricaulis sp. TaxID=2003553 RepID=UPI0025EB1ECF|nr:hypothetical protein [Sulfuricaulis sp.]MCR4347220.1 hypothetical protein [Sulfuricaulis sp.]
MLQAINIHFGAGSIIENLMIANYCGGMVAYGAGSPSCALPVSVAASRRRNN